MPETHLTNRQTEILALLARNPSGLTSDGILNGLNQPPALRTVQRWLAGLAAERLVAAVGKGKATVYKLLAPLDLHAVPHETNTFGAEEMFGSYIPLSEEGREIFSYVRRPKAGRTPVGYQRDFLDYYIPNETWYLSESVRLHLKRIGITNDHGRPAGTYGRAILSRLLIDLSWASSRLEGNTYSRLDTQKIT